MEDLISGDEGSEDDFFDEYEDDFDETDMDSGYDESDAWGEESEMQENAEDDWDYNDLDNKMDEASRQQMEEYLQSQYEGLVNPVTGQPITTEDEMFAYQQAMVEEENSRRMMEMGIDPSALKDIIENHPTILAAQKIQMEQEERETESFARDELEKLITKYPDCGLTDLNQLEQSEAGRATLLDWAKTGDLAKAYIANFHEDILQRRMAAVKQGKLNEINSKRHLRQPHGNGGGMDAMSQEEYKTWKGFFPDASYKEIQKIWRENKE